MWNDPNWTNGDAQGRLEAGEHFIDLAGPRETAANAFVWVRKHINWHYFERATNARYKA